MKAPWVAFPPTRRSRRFWLAPRPQVGFLTTSPWKRPRDYRIIPDAGRRSLPAVLHLRNDCQSRSSCCTLSRVIRWASLDHVLDRHPGKRHSPEHQLARLGQACLELRLRAVECRRHDLRSRRCRDSAPQMRCARSKNVGVTTLCAPPTVWRMMIRDELGHETARLARIGQRRRAAESRGDRAGREGVGTDHPRRLWPDRDNSHDRQLAGTDGEDWAAWGARCRDIRSAWSI